MKYAQHSTLAADACASEQSDADCSQTGSQGRAQVRVEPTLSSSPCSQFPESAPKLELESFRIRVSGRVIPLRPTEQRLLSILRQSPDCLVDYQVLIKCLYGNIPLDVGRVRLKRLVADIRSHLGPKFAGLLRTVPKFGLVLDEDAADLP